MTRTGVRIATLALAFLALLPAVSLAQSGIVGIVRDTSGGVLPGVTVEAASPALIEKVRTAVTDDQGRYNIVDLRPGTYTVTFSLAGFNTVKRDGIELPASFTATVNADLPVGALEETITVSGQAPVVDVQNVAQQKTLSKELLDAVPTGRLPQSYAVLVPGTTASGAAYSGGLHNSFVQQSLSFHGAGGSQFATDGFDHSHNLTGGAQYTINQGTVQEVVVSAGGASAEQQVGSVVTNVIPKEGGNVFSGQMYFHYANENFIGKNLTDELKAVGATSQTIREQWDFNPAVGGPLKQDKLWFFGSYRNTGAEVDSGSRYDVNPLDWVYTPDLTRPTASEKIADRNYSLRLTWQATQKNKISAYYDYQPKDWYNRLISGVVAPEASQWAPYKPQYLAQLIWKSPVSSRLLLEAGSSYQLTTLNLYENDRDAFTGLPVSPDLRARSAVDLNTNIQFRGVHDEGIGIWHTSRALRTRAAASYVTGTHAIKVGTYLLRGSRYIARDRADYTVAVRSGVPARITLWAPEVYTSRVRADLGLFVQDQWTLSRLTLNVGLRYDYYRTDVPAQDVPANRWLPARHFDPVKQVVGWHNLSPRIGGSFDLFGTGRTAIKVSLSRYVDVEGTGLTNQRNPVVTSVLSANRDWADANGNFVPDCNFSDPNANGECGRLSDLNFGRQNPRATQVDPDLLKGFGKRPFNWETNAAIQHELVPGLAVQGGYFRRSFGNFRVTDNLAVTPADYDPYCITVPVDARLPNGGGNQLCGFYDVSRAKFGQRESFVTLASNFGERKQVSSGVELTVSARFPNGAQVTGGTSTGHLSNNTCFAVDSPQELLFCDVKPPFQTQFKMMGLYPLPWWGIQASGAFQSLPGPELSTTTYVARNAEIRTTLGRDLASGANGTVTLPLMQAGTLYGTQFNKLDIRLSKVLRFGGRRVTGSLDIFNILNGAGIVQRNTRYGPTYLNPIQVLGARFFRVSGQFDF